MIYKNEYGSVDFMSEEFLRSLYPSKKDVGVKLSGGTDSSLLFYMLVKEIHERNLDFNLYPYTLLDVPGRHINAQMIINVVKEEFPDVNIADLYFNTEFKGKKSHQWHEVSMMFAHKYNIAFFTNGVNLSPPIEIVGEADHIKMNTFAVRNFSNLESLGIINTVEYMPFKDTDKRYTAQLYKDLNLMDSIYPLTRSCLGSAEDTNYWEKPCKKCFWCKERLWAFGEYEKEDF